MVVHMFLVNQRIVVVLRGERGRAHTVRLEKTVQKPIRLVVIRILRSNTVFGHGRTTEPTQVRGEPFRRVVGN